MGGHQVGHDILLLAAVAARLFEAAHEALIDVGIGLAHIVQHPAADMLGRGAQLAADVVFGQLLQQRAALVVQQVVVADAAADKDLFDARQGAQPPQHAQVGRLVEIDVGAGRREQALAVGAGARRPLLPAGGMAEVGRRPADVVDVALEGRVGDHARRLAQHRFLAARRHAPALVHHQGAEVAAAEAAAVVGDGKPHLLQRRHAARGVVVGVPGAGIGQLVDGVEVAAREGRLGRVLDQIARPGRLDQRPAAEGVVLVLLGHRGPGIGQPALAHRLEGRQQHGVGEAAFVRAGRQKAGAAHVADLRRARPLPEPPGDLGHAALAHAVGEQVGAAVLEDAAAHGVVPVVIMRKAAQGGLDPADDHRRVGKGLSGAVAVNDDGAVGAAAALPAGGIEVVAAPLFGHGVVGDHRVEIAGVDQHGEARPAHGAEGVRRVPVGLGEDGDAEPRLFQHAADDRGAEGRMIHIGVARDQQKVIPVPAAGDQVVAADGQKVQAVGHQRFSLRRHISFHWSLVISTARGLLPSKGPTMPRSSMMSTSRAARA